MRNFAFVFARGGSKGLPGKNIKHLQGKPLLQYSIDIALECPSISQVFVSTDDAKIAEVANHCGAIVINRPNELATDKSPEWLSWQHAIEWAQMYYGHFDYFVSLPATSPLRSVQDVEKALDTVSYRHADICIGVTPASRNPYFNMVELNEDGSPSLIMEPSSSVIRRQDAPNIYDITTVVYVAKPEFIMSQTGIFSGNLTSIEIPKPRAIDIDDIYDFWLAEAILKEGS